MADTEILTDLEKAGDFLILNKKDFLKSYSYVTEQEYDEALKELKEDITSNLAELMRRAENVHIENLNGRDTGLAVTGEQLKEAINDYACQYLTEEELEEYEDICNSMAC